MNLSPSTGTPRDAAAREPRRAVRWAWWLFHAAVVLLPTVLLWNPAAQFTYDWHNHQWFIGYTGEYFRQHLAFPQVFNAAPIVGLPQPIFYGYLFYPALGLISAFTGAALALRIAVVGALATQYAATFVGARSAGYGRFPSAVLGASLAWGSYALSNLYNRAALTEFFAVALWIAAWGFWYAAVSRRQTGMGTLAAAGGACAIAAFGFHPPTALVGAGFLGVVAAGLLIAARPWSGQKKCVVAAAGVATAALLMLGPWVYANLRFSGDLYITGKLRNFMFFPERTDSWVGRFAPIPYDPLAVKLKGAVSTPYVEAQVAFTLLVVVAVQLFSTLRRGLRALGPVRSTLLLLCLGWFIFVCALSLSPALAKAFAFLAPYVQFPSRLVSHANVALLIAAFALAPREGERHNGRQVLWILAFAIATTGLAIKLKHAAYVRELAHEPRYAWRGERSALVTAGRLDAASDYAAVRRLPQLLPRTVKASARAEFPVGASGSAFGVVGSTSVELATENWVITNAVVFPWADVRVNGKHVAPRQRAAHEHRLALRLPPGKHTLEWVWQPDPLWVWLRRIAALTALFGVTAGVGLVWRSKREKLK